MCSTSTIILKRSDNFKDKKACKKRSLTNTLLSAFLWSLAAVVSASDTEMAGNGTGVSVSFKIHQILSMMLTTLLLTTGFKTNNPYFIIPWISFTIWSMYNRQIPNLVKMLKDLQYTKNVPKLAWVALGCDALGTGMKLVLVIHVIQLIFNMWYQNKLINETTMKN